ncbi:MAG: E2 ligase fold family C protein [Bacteroidetes bacterium]|nr:E2 ligase fold family C protein [Bacteroidota bacterium]
MALANFFDKCALNAAQILNQFNREAFENILTKNYIGIVYDKSALNSSEARMTLDLLVRIAARLYPNMQIIGIGGAVSDYSNGLQILAKSINPDINLSSKVNPNIAIVVGDSVYNETDCLSIYAGSNSWVLKQSKSRPVSSGSSNNPFGAGAAACFATAHLFCYVFKDQLDNPNFDDELTLSLLDFSNGSNQTNTKLENIENFCFKNTTLVGAGAIGNAALWALKNLNSVQGEITILDNEDISLTNLQRYVMTTQNNIDRKKVEFAKEILDKSKLKINPVCLEWEEYINAGNNKNLDNILVAVDSAKARINIQSSLPKHIYNSWTQQNDLGVSIHSDFVDENACLMCLYLPDQPTSSKSVIMADALGIPDLEPNVRKAIELNSPLDSNLLNIIALRNGIETTAMNTYIGKDINTFYSEAICGGFFLKLTGKANNQKQVEVPTPFESAFAGILIVSEFIKSKLGLNVEQSKKHIRFNLFKNVNYDNITSKEIKRPHLKCICQDEDFTNAYQKKWK